MRVVGSGNTRRRQIVDHLTGSKHDFEGLRQLLGVPVHVLDEDLRHVARTVRGSGGRLHVERATCADCGFGFRQERFRPPGRCPRCRGHRIIGPTLWISQ
jgi:predicted Zn-ribbon and HTH transcriptional regulator